MPDQYASAVYHVAEPGRVPPGRLIHAEDRPGGQADIFFHPLHVRGDLIWDCNWVTRHMVGNGMWRQRWTNDGRMLEPAKGLGIAISRWEIVPRRAMPRGLTVMPVEEEGSCIWLIREGCCTRAMRDEMNRMLERIAGDGLWLQYWFDRYALSPAASAAAPPAVSLPA